jgi:hypothetical protein
VVIYLDFGPLVLKELEPVLLDLTIHVHFNPHYRFVLWIHIKIYYQTGFFVLTTRYDFHRPQIPDLNHSPQSLAYPHQGLVPLHSFSK